MILATALLSCSRHDLSTSGTISVSSPTIPAGGTIPRIHAMTPKGQNVAPAISWSGIPEGTKEIVVIVDDPDAGATPFSHWVVYGISPTATGLPEGIPADEPTARGVTQGHNDFKRLGWGGPDPPEGDRPHHYAFWVYALSKPLELPPGEWRGSIIEALRGRTLATGHMLATYGK